MIAVSDSAASSKPARSGSGEPVASARSSAWSSSACHSNHAGPTSSGGAAPARTAHACTRSGSSAAHASAADPPPDQPATRNVEMHRDGRRARRCSPPPAPPRAPGSGSSPRSRRASTRRAHATIRGRRGDLRERHGRARGPDVEDEQRLSLRRSRPAELQRPPAVRGAPSPSASRQSATNPPRLSVRRVKMAPCPNGESVGRRSPTNARSRAGRPRPPVPVRRRPRLPRDRPSRRRSAGASGLSDPARRGPVPVGDPVAEAGRPLAGQALRTALVPDRRRRGRVRASPGPRSRSTSRRCARARSPCSFEERPTLRIESRRPGRAAAVRVPSRSLPPDADRWVRGSSAAPRDLAFVRGLSGTARRVDRSDPALYITNLDR